MGMTINEDDVCSKCGCFWCSTGACANGHWKYLQKDKISLKEFEKELEHRRRCECGGQYLQGKSDWPSRLVCDKCHDYFDLSGSDERTKDFDDWLAKEHPNLNSSNRASYKSIQRMKKAYEAGQKNPIRTVMQIHLTDKEGLPLHVGKVKKPLWEEYLIRKERAKIIETLEKEFASFKLNEFKKGHGNLTIDYLAGYGGAIKRLKGMK